MLVYVTMIIWCLFWGHFLDNEFRCQNTGQKIFILMLPFLAIFIVSAIRYDVGVDYSGTYTNTYLRLLSGDVDDRVEPLIMFLYKIIVFLGLNLQWFFVATSFVVCFFVDKCIKQQSSYKQLSYFIFICGTFLFYSYNGTRQSIGIILFYYSLYFLMRNKNSKSLIKKDSVKFLFSNIIGSLTHLSSAVFLPLYFVIKKKVPAWIKGAVLVGLFLANSYFVPYIMQVLVGTKFRIYVNNGAYSTEDAMNMSMIINLIILVAYEISLRKKDDYDEKDVIYDNIHFYGAIVSMFVTSIPLALRIFLNFRYIEFLSIPNLITHVNVKYRKLVITGVYLFYFVYFVLMVGIRNGNEVLPYKTIFFK